MAERKPFLLRIDADLYAELARWADAEKRSLNGQIEFLLQRVLREAQRAQASTGRTEQLSAPLGRQPEHASGVRRREPASLKTPAPRPSIRKPSGEGARRHRPKSASVPPSGVLAQRRWPTPKEGTAERRPAPASRRIPASPPAARKPSVESPPARVPDDNWDAMVD